MEKFVQRSISGKSYTETSIISFRNYKFRIVRSVNLDLPGPSIFSRTFSPVRVISRCEFSIVRYYILGITYVDNITRGYYVSRVYRKETFLPHRIESGASHQASFIAIRSRYVSISRERANRQFQPSRCYALMYLHIREGVCGAERIEFLRICQE